MAERSPEAETMSGLILEVFRLNRQLLDAGDALAEPAGLTSARWQVLGVVEHGPIPAAQVARTMGLTRQGVQRTADSLEAEGLISYEPNPQHRRAQLLALTPKGRAALDIVQRRHAEWVERLVQGHSPEALSAAVDLLRQVRTCLEREGPSDED
jgi:DNA-binding MarR family transcriptional regulator